MDNRVQRGASAEDHATQLLVNAGYRIVERNFRCKAGELDIVARDGDVLVFVEVRSRSNDDHGSAVDHGSAAERGRAVAVHPDRQLRLSLQLPHRGPRGPRWDRRLAVRSPL